MSLDSFRDAHKKMNPKNILVIEDDETDSSVLFKLVSVLFSLIIFGYFLFMMKGLNLKLLVLFNIAAVVDDAKLLRLDDFNEFFLTLFKLLFAVVVLVLLSFHVVDDEVDVELR